MLGASCEREGWAEGEREIERNEHVMVLTWRLREVLLECLRAGLGGGYVQEGWWNDDEKVVCVCVFGIPL